MMKAPKASENIRAMRSEGQRLLCAIEASLSQVALAAGCSAKQSVANWRAGTKTPDAPFREKLHAAYGIPVESWTRAPGTAAPRSTSATSSPTTTSHSPEGPSTVGDLDALIGHLRVELAKPDLASSERVKLSGSMTRALALRHRLEKEEELLEDRIIREHPSWRRVEAALARALAPYPDAARAVAAALAEAGFEP